MKTRGRRKRRQAPKSRPPRRSPTPPPIVVEEIDLVDEDDDSANVNYHEEISAKPSTSSSAPVASKKVDMDVSDSDPILISTLVKEHCVVCLSRKTRTIFSISAPSSTEEADGYELLRRYFGIRTADCLNDIYDAVVFTDKGLLTSEFPAPLLCERCVKVVRELDELHKKLESIQTQVLVRIRNVRRHIVENGSSIKTGKRPSVSRLQFENELLESCNGHQRRTEVALGILDKFQDVFKEDTHDKIEIHLEHLDQMVATVSCDEDLGADRVDDQPDVPVKPTTTSVSTQTDKTFGFSHYDVKIVKVSIDCEEEEEPKANEVISDDAPPSSPVNFDNDDIMDNESPVPPQENIATVEDEDVKPDVVVITQTVIDVNAGNLNTAKVDADSLNTVESDADNLHTVESDADNLHTVESDADNLHTVQIDADNLNIIQVDTENLNIVEVATSEPSSPWPLPPSSPVGQIIQLETAGELKLPRENSYVPTHTSSSSIIQQQTSNDGISIIRETRPNGSVITIVKDKAKNKKEGEEKTTTVSENKDDILAKKILTPNEAAPEPEEPSGSSSESEEESEEESSESDSSLESESESEDDETDEEPKTKRKRGENSSNETSNPKQFQCSLCKQYFNRRTDVYRHIRLIHQTEPVLDNPGQRLTCTECHFACRRMHELKLHMKNIHKMQMPRQLNNRTYTCSICGYNKGGLQLVGFLDHLWLHESTKKTVSCDDCLQKFTTNMMLQMHPCPQAGKLPGTVTILMENFDRARKDNGYKCRICDGEQKFHTEKGIQYHFITEHKDSHPFLCEICGGDVAFKSKNCLKTHMIETHDAVKYKCRICEKGKEEFSRYDDLHVHMNYKHFGGFFACVQCSQKFSSREKLEEHSICHTAEQLHICNLCEAPFKTPGALRTHKDRNHKDDEAELLDNNEPELDENGEPLPKRPRPTKPNLYTHRPSKNGEPKPFVCTLCDYDCSTSTLHRRHMQIEHGIIVDRKLNTRTYQCELCDYTNSNTRLKGFVQHLQEHETSSKKFTCEDCFDTFTYRQLYQYHPCPQTGKLPGTATIHTEGYNVKKTQYPCRFCETVFSSESACQKHCLKVHSENAFPCELCDLGISFFSKYALKTHLITTHGAVPYKCRLCVPTKEFTKMFDIFYHTNMEHFGCCYQCPHCDKKYVERRKLENHMTSHSDARGHICNFCGSALKSITTLRRHIKVHHTNGGEKKHVCEYCSKPFLERSNLMAHIKRLHKNTETEKSESEQEMEQEAPTRKSTRQRKRKAK